MFDMTTAADHLLADILDMGLEWDDLDGLLHADPAIRAGVARDHVSDRANELRLGLAEDELADAVDALVEVLSMLADMGIDSMLALQGALAALAGDAGRHAA